MNLAAPRAVPKSPNGETSNNHADILICLRFPPATHVHPLPKSIQPQHPPALCVRPAAGARERRAPARQVCQCVNFSILNSSFFISYDGPPPQIIFWTVIGCFCLLLAVNPCFFHPLRHAHKGGVCRAVALAKADATDFARAAGTSRRSHSIFRIPGLDGRHRHASA